MFQLHFFLILSFTIAATATCAAAQQLNTVHLRGGSVSNKTTRSRDLQSSSCTLGNNTRDPGEWLAGPDSTCMCDRQGTGEWIFCENNRPKQHTNQGLTALDRRQQFDKVDFMFDLQGSRPASITASGTIQSLDVGEFPVLAGEGLSYTLVNLEPCGINLPHVHPRAAELVYVIKGNNLQVAFVEENGTNSRVIVNEVGAGGVTFVPQALIQYQQNLSCERVTFLAALSSEDPGVSSVSTEFFRLPSEVVQGVLNENESRVQELINGLVTGPVQGHNACLSKCGLN